MKIAYLLDQLGSVTEIGQLRDACGKVLRDNNYLQLKRAVSDVQEWAGSYHSVTRIYPTQTLFQENVDAAIKEAGRVAERTDLQQAEDLLRRLQEYRDSIPSLWNGN